MRALIETIFWVCHALPEPVAIASGRVLGRVLDHLVRFRRQTISRHLAQAFPDLDAPARNRLLHRVYRHFGLLLLELLRLPRTSREELLEKCVFSGLEHADRALAEGRGIFVLAAHVGNWELGLAATVCRGYRTHAITKEIKGGAGEYAAGRMRGAHGVATIPRRNSVRKIMRTLRENLPVGFVLDQNMTAEEGVFVDFFGRPACTMPGLAVLAKRCRCPVLPVAFYRDDDLRRHHIDIHPPLEWEELAGDPEEEIRRNTQRYTRALEDMIRAHPDQWLWMHRRWKTRPPVTEQAGAAPAAQGELTS